MMQILKGTPTWVFVIFFALLAVGFLQSRPRSVTPARTPLKELLAQLEPARFRQIHRGTIVNLAEVAAATRDESGRLSVRLKHRKESLPVSRVFAELFRSQ